jgi:hypothetical protein
MTTVPFFHTDQATLTRDVATTLLSDEEVTSFLHNGQSPRGDTKHLFYGNRSTVTMGSHHSSHKDNIMVDTTSPTLRSSKYDVEAFFGGERKKKNDTLHT